MGPTRTTNPGEQELLGRARAGDEDAFARLVSEHRGQLHAHCYRMLGSVHDAEDALQDAMLRAWRGLPKFDGRSSLKTWLYRISTNTCLDVIGRRPKRVLPVDHGPATDPADGVGQPLVESVWIEPYPDETLAVEDGHAAPESRYEQRESLELAFVAAMQHLPPRQRATLILREVLGFSAKEVADSLDSSTASVNSALQRARKTVEEVLPEQSQQSTLRSLGDKKLRKIIEAYMEAMQNGDVPKVVSMLAEEDAAWSMPPLSSWFGGREQITGFLRGGPLSGEWRWRHVPVRVNGQAAIAAYNWDPDRGHFRPFALDVLTFEGDRIKQVTAFIPRSIKSTDPEYYARWPLQEDDPVMLEAFFGRFGLPDHLD